MEKACYLIDTTLRDGEQSPGLALGSRDKIILAQLLDELGVYAIEGGIPAMGRIEQEAVLGMRSVCRKARIAVGLQAGHLPDRHGNRSTSCRLRREGRLDSESRPSSWTG